tara:strand:+ start:257 stop:922 length:666 start_codon:yes stop_codon:yes gene_type:complete
MRIERASRKAVDYACKKFHYAQNAAPRAHDLAFSVFNNASEWCGCVCFGRGATNDIGKPYGLRSGECIELIRVALNGKQKNVSSILAVCLKLIKKHAPLTKMVVSFADTEQGHSGTIYQATNWIYCGLSKSVTEYILNGKRIHGRTYRAKGKPKGAEKVKGSQKHRYIYPLHKSMIPLCKSLAQPYPKKQAQEVNEDKRPASSRETGGSSPTLALKNLETN